MTYLIDTHVLLWLLFTPKKLSKTAKSIIQNPNHTIFVSPVSLWEISLKYSIGKLRLIGYLPEDIEQAIDQLNLTILELNTQQILTSYKLTQNPHKDPFDRLLIWQAISLSMPIITKDAAFLYYKNEGLEIIW